MSRSEHGAATEVDWSPTQALNEPMASSRHCYKCGRPYTRAAAPGRSETCDGCGADLRVCLNCVSYDPQAAYQCRDRRAEPVAEKHRANFCEWFEFAYREWAGPPPATAREQQARQALRKLLGD